jgi:hypothetical protein
MRTCCIGAAGARNSTIPLTDPGTPSFLTPRGVEQKLNLVYNTVMRAIGQLRDQGIVIMTTEAKRDRVFCAKTSWTFWKNPLVSPLPNGRRQLKFPSQTLFPRLRCASEERRHFMGPESER